MLIGSTSKTENTATPIGQSNEMGLMIGRFLTSFDAIFKNALKDKDYGDSGIKKFIAVLLSVDGGDLINQRNLKWANRIERNKNYYGEIEISISMSVDIHPDKLKGMSIQELEERFLQGLIYKLYHPSIKIPKKFQYELFRKDLVEVLELCAESKLISGKDDLEVGVENGI